ncbi:multicomponent Na+:H+ antiporter subunit D [Halalkaliarchaeum desulfuricum]|uniref:Multicomponent Na+:H+ antiporter subunit D n=1 Tax=Halalkaliarchaeum desulfuricum TaxID=2055893 RepID=A0A343TIH2_9EURY|nr:Na(+)/H(+) antiporter subunit D [Halalkaliarchaeum desulfuricum]AUX08894.1 multicomponent Na+:H+ antiporter subunit D [Halalkaliarchaeum desulfuricum]
MIDPVNLLTVAASVDVPAYPPAGAVLVAAALALVLPRRAAHWTASLVLFGVLGWILLLPDGVGATVRFLEYDLIVVAVDDVSRLVGLAFAGFGALAVLYADAAGFDRRHLAAALGYVAAALWAVFAGDWLGLLIGWEIMALSSTLLVWLHGGDAIRAGYRYAIWHGLGGGLFAAGVAAHTVAGGGFTAAALQFDGTGIAPGLPTLLVGTAVAINAGVIGLHAWLPDTYPRPHVATSVFLCVYTTKTAVYAAYRAFPDGQLLLAYVGGVMTVYGAGYALAQKDMRRLLSYHIQAQVGYMLAGIGIGSALGVAGGFAHLFNNVLYKGLLFMVAGIVVLRTGRNRLDEFGAIGTAAPVVLVVFLAAALSISAVPGFNGFVSKGMVIDASVAANRPTLRWLLIAGGVGTVMSFTKFGYYAFLEGSDEGLRDTRDATDDGLGDTADDGLRDASLQHAVVGLAIAAACVFFGLNYGVLFSLLPATDAWATDPYSTSHLIEGFAIVAAGLVGFVLAKGVLDRLHGGVDVDVLQDRMAFYGMRWLVGAITATYRVVDDRASAVGWTAGRAVRAPVETIAGLLPPGFEDRYRRRARRTPGETGTKLSLRSCLYLTALVIAVALGVALA